MKKEYRQLVSNSQLLIYTKLDGVKWKIPQKKGTISLQCPKKNKIYGYHYRKVNMFRRPAMIMILRMCLPCQKEVNQNAHIGIPHKDL